MVAAGAFALALSATSAYANLVSNGGFESVTPPAGNPGGIGFRLPEGTITDWTFTQPSTPGYVYAYGYLVNPAAFPTFSPDGYAIYSGSLPSSSPVGGNFIGADGDPQFNSIISQTLTGLTVGTDYTVSFWQAAGQQNNRTGETTEWWRVSLGGQTIDSAVMSTPSQGTSGWNFQTLGFRATSVTEVLSFMSMGTPLNLPPTVLLDGVTAEAIPEPAAIGLLLTGIGGLIAAKRRRKRSA